MSILVITGQRESGKTTALLHTLISEYEKHYVLKDRCFYGLNMPGGVSLPNFYWKALRRHNVLENLTNSTIFMDDIEDIVFTPLISKRLMYFLVQARKRDVSIVVAASDRRMVDPRLYRMADGIAVCNYNHGAIEIDLQILFCKSVVDILPGEAVEVSGDRAVAVIKDIDSVWRRAREIRKWNP